MEELQHLDETLPVAAGLIFLFVGSSLGKAHGPSIQDIAASTGLTESRVSRNVFVLEERGLLRKDRDPHNARVKHVSLTDTGCELLTRLTSLTAH